MGTYAKHTSTHAPLPSSSPLSHSLSCIASVFFRNTGFYGREKLREKLKFFCNFWSRTFALETFAARPLWGEESFVHGTGRMRRRDGLLFIEQRQQASTPFTRHRETGQSDTQKYGNQVGDATSGAIRFQSKQGIPPSHPLLHKLWTQTLSTYMRSLHSCLLYTSPSPRD